MYFSQETNLYRQFKNFYSEGNIPKFAGDRFSHLMLFIRMRFRKNIFSCKYFHSYWGIFARKKLSVETRNFL